MRVHNNTKQGWVVIVMTLSVFMVLVVFGWISEGGRTKQYLLNGMKDSLGRSYAEICTNKFNGQSGVTTLITRDETRTAFIGTNIGRLKYPSFIPPQDIWISTEPVKLMTSNLLCVVLVFNSDYYGIDANGKFDKILEKEFVKWPHVSVMPAEKK